MDTDVHSSPHRARQFHNDMSETRPVIPWGECNARWGEDGRGILLGDNAVGRGGMLGPIRLQCAGFCVSSGLLFVYTTFSWLIPVLKIWWIVVQFKFNSLAIIRTVSRRSDRTTARTFYTFLSVFEVEGVPERDSSLMDSRPSENALYHLGHLWSRERMLPIGVFQFTESLNAGFPKFDTKLDCISLLEIALFHFRDTHTHKNCFTKNHTKISVVKLASWNSY